MKVIPALLLADYAKGSTTLAVCAKATLKSGTVIGFADHDEDIIVSGVTYVASRGAFMSDFEQRSRLAFDNVEGRGFYDSAVTKAGLAAGEWDLATVQVFVVNWKTPSNGIDIITEVKVGQNTQEKLGWVTELRGKISAYTQSIGWVVQPTCRYEFGDSFCTKALGPLTVTGTLSAVSSDGLVLSDPARTEAGPAGPKTITAISQAQYAQVTAAAHGFVQGQAVYIATVVGMTQINGQWHLVKSVIDANNFTLYTDTREFTAYASGGTAAPAGDAGYFGAGKITMTSGASNGLSMEVKVYSPGLITLQLQLPRTVTAGDTYSLVAGCGKRFIEDCVTRWANGINFGGEPHVPGMDKMFQVGGA